MGTNSAALTEYDLGILIQQAEYELKGGTPEENAFIMRRLFEGESGAIRDHILFYLCSK